MRKPNELLRLRRRLTCAICGKPKILSVQTSTYEAERDAFIKALRAGDDAAILIGLHWHNLTHGLLRGHYASAKAFLQAELKGTGIDVPKPSTLRQMARVAHVFRRPVGVGWYLLFLALRYWQLAGVTTFSISFPGNEMIRVPQPGGGGVMTKPLQVCDEDDLKRAIKQFRKQPEPDLSPKEIAFEKILQAGAAKLAGSKGKSSVLFRRTKDGLVGDIHIVANVDKLVEFFNRIL